MTTYEDDERNERAYTSACVSTCIEGGTHALDASKMWHWRSWLLQQSWCHGYLTVCHGYPSLWSLRAPTSWAWYVGILVVLLYGYTEQRLRTMQIRLARMHDLLHRIAGDSAEEQDELLMELVAEVGPVKPDPELWPSRD
jgi:hypothetical protein